MSAGTSPTARGALGIHLLLLLPYAGLLLIAPRDAALVLLAVWLVLLGVLWACRTSPLVMLVPFGAAALLPLSISVGELLLGWRS